MITRREYLKQTALAGCGLALTRATAAEPNAQIEGRGSLKAHAHKRGLLAGCAVSAANLHEDAFTRVLAEQYDLVVAENAMKFGPIQPKPDSYFFDDADALVAFAERHKMKVRGHNFVWHEQLPAWFAGTATKENARKILTDHIMTVASRYKGKIQSWDVVNEAINVSDGRSDSLRKSPWLELMGPEYLAVAYRTARQADPKAKLTYNEYGIENESEDDARKRAATLELLKRLKAAGVPLDALGIQSHISAGKGQTFGKGLRELIDGAQSLGLEVYLTELDVNDDAVENNDIAACDQIVAGMYRDYLSVALENKAVKAVLTWGMTDAHTWLNGIKSHKEKQPNRPQRPLPFDAEYKPAPAFFALRDALDHAPRR
ncbi:MAG TPA: endo-1,4-beta-xylanase [Terracidiphilus sp.]|nr:endo-1,4-beta-xylanase [Terracidiphilus sp.]